MKTIVKYNWEENELCDNPPEANPSEHLIQIPETEMEKSLLFCFLCVSIGLHPADTVPYDCDEHGVWRHPASRQSCGSQIVPEYIISREEYSGEEYPWGILWIHELKRTTLSDGRSVVCTDYPEKVLTNLDPHFLV